MIEAFEIGFALALGLNIGADLYNPVRDAIRAASLALLIAIVEAE